MMRTVRRLVPRLSLALAVTGCVLTSGQFVVTYKDFADPLVVGGPGAIYRHTVDLNTIGDYRDHKDDLQGLLDFALVGLLTNNPGSSAVDVQVWLTPDPTSHATASALLSDPTAVQVWGPFQLAPGQTRRLGWDESAALLKIEGKQVLIGQVKGDGIFTLYLLGAAGTYSFTIADAALILVLDAGI